MLTAVFFDAAGTLIHLPRPVGEHYAEVARRFGGEWSAGDLERAFRQAWKSMPARPPTPDGGARPDDDRPWWRTLVGRVLDQVAPPPVGFDAEAFFEAVYAHFAQPGVWAAFPDVAETLTFLRERGLRLAVVSNFDRRLRAVLTHLGLAGYFEHVVLSSEEGSDKPDARIFRRALTKVGVPAVETLHVGDEPGKDGGAEAVGVRVFHLERPGRGLETLRAAVARGEY